MHTMMSVINNTVCLKVAKNNGKSQKALYRGVEGQDSKLEGLI